MLIAGRDRDSSRMSISVTSEPVPEAVFGQLKCPSGPVLQVSWLDGGPFPPLALNLDVYIH
jgi:hypothetical protein